MTNFVIFEPKAKIVGKESLNDFIEFSQQLPRLSKELDYDSAYWSGVVNFTKFGASSKSRDKSAQLHPSIMPFAKAYLTYTQTQNRTRNPNEIKALRAIDAAMLKSHGVVDVTQLDTAVLDNAAQIIRDNLGSGTAYHGGAQLQKLQEFLVGKHIIPSFTWKNPIPRASDTVEKVGEEGVRNREKKLPDEDALLAIADIFNKGVDNLSDRDNFTTSIMAILLCAPARGSEPFYLKVDCLHYDKDKKGNNAVGLKWFSGKGFGHEVEWVPDAMVSTVEEAVKRLKVLSASARQWAEKIEEVYSAVNAGEIANFPVHLLCPSVPDDKPLTRNQVAQALGYNLDVNSNKFVSNAGGYLRNRGLGIVDGMYCLNDLIPALIKSMPEGFPYVPFKTGHDVKVKWSEALFSFHSCQLNLQKSTNKVLLWMPNINTLNEDLAKTKKKQKGSGALVNVRSIFERHGYPSSYIITSHQIRHMLSTIAKVNGMSDQVLTKWAARADAKHNRVYNHTSPEQYSERYALIKSQNKGESELGLREYEIMTPETLQEINTRAIQTAHVTEYGACILDFIMSPCSKHRDCINCEQQVCIKGDDEKLERLRKRLEREKRIIVTDKAALDDGLLGADRHYEKRLTTIQRCEDLIMILSDENLPDGTAVKLSIERVSGLDKALDKNHKKRLPKIEKIKRPALEDLPNKPRALKHFLKNKRA